MDGNVSRRQTLIGMTSAALVTQPGLSLAAPVAQYSLSMSLRLAQWQRCIITEHDEQNRRVHISAEFSPATGATASLPRVNLLWYRTYRRTIRNEHPDLAYLLPIDIGAMSMKEDRHSLRNRVQRASLFPDSTSERPDLLRGKAFSLWIARSPREPFQYDLHAEGSIIRHDHTDDENFSLGCKLECGQNSEWLSRQQRVHNPLSSWIFDVLCTHLQSQPYPLAPDDGGLWMPYSFIPQRANMRYV